MNRLLIYFSLAGTLMLVSCSNLDTQKPAADTSNAKSSPDLEAFRATGNSVATLAQKTLLKNVTAAIEKGGTGYAVEFCNLKATQLIDSLNLLNNCRISRMSDRKRNPDNGFKTATDEAIWAWFSKKHATQSAASDTLLYDGSRTVAYYKPISIAMPACLKCHGDPQTMEIATRKKINRLYPADEAFGYREGDLRGMWKIEFELPASR